MNRCRLAKRPRWTRSCGWLAVIMIWIAASAWTSRRLYWDECLYLYSVAEFTVGDLIGQQGGLFASGIFPGNFFGAKIGLVAMLAGLHSVWGQGAMALAAIQATFALTMLCTMLASLALVRMLWPACDPLPIAALMLLQPLGVWLSPKILSEGPSLLLGTLSMLALTRSLRVRGRSSRLLWLSASAVLLAGAGAMRIYGLLVLGIFGLVLLLHLPRADSRAVLISAVGVGLSAVLLLAALMQSLGLDPVACWLGPLRSVVAKPTVDLAARLYGPALFMGASGLVLLCALIPPWDRATVIWAAWLALASLPFAYGHEPRYHFMAMLPFALLTWRGCQRAAGWLRLPEGWRERGAWLILTTLLAANVVLLGPLMPYEVDQPAFKEAMALAQAKAPDAAVLFPWHVDYAYARYMWPEPDALCALDRNGDAAVVATPGWLAWVGVGRYAAGETVLADGRSFAYLGWSYHPTVLHLRELLSLVGLVYHADMEASALRDHRALSSLWNHPRATFEELGSRGMYTVYDVRRID